MRSAYKTHRACGISERYGELPNCNQHLNYADADLSYISMMPCLDCTFWFVSVAHRCTYEHTVGYRFCF